MSESEFILLGVILGVHGIKGDITIKSYTQPIDNITKFKLTDDHGKICQLTAVKKVNSTKLIYKLAGCNNRTQAEQLVGTKLYCHKDDLPKKEENEFYFTELKGKNVFDLSGCQIGKISGIFNFGAGDLVEITFSITSKKQSSVKLYPFTRELFPEISEQYVTLSQINII